MKRFTVRREILFAREGIDNIRWVAEDTEYANVLEVVLVLGMTLEITYYVTYYISRNYNFPDLGS